MDPIPGIALRYRKPISKIVDGKLETSEEIREKFFTTQELVAVIEAKEKHNYAARVHYQKKKLKELEKSET